MDVCSLARPAGQILTRARCSRQLPTLLPVITVRGHKTAARTKRALKVAPHDSFLPDRSTPMPTPVSSGSSSSTGRGDHIIYNPPASEASPFHTPFLFLPQNDPRRAALVRMRISHAATLTPTGGAHAVTSEADLPPQMKYTRRTASYNLDEAAMQEMKRLRQEDPATWTVKALATKFNCSPIMVSIAAPAPAEHTKWREAKIDRQRERWGPIKTKAREDRQRRAEMLYHGEL